MPAPLRTTARITAFRPGQSPPPVSTPMRIYLVLPVAVRSPRTLEGVVERTPASQVVPRVGEGVVLIGGCRRQRRAAGVLPALPELVREPRDGPRQGPHVAPQLRERDMVVG